jgi:hypothetical protein
MVRLGLPSSRMEDLHGAAGLAREFPCDGEVLARAVAGRELVRAHCRHERTARRDAVTPAVTTGRP